MAISLASAIALWDSAYLPTVASPQRSQSDTAQYYQDYQPVVVPTQTEPSQPSSSFPTPASVSTPAPGAIEPAWIVPSAVSSPAPVNAPTVNAPVPVRPTTPANPPARTNGAAEVAVVVTDVQVAGVGPDLQQFVRETIKTKVGGQTTPAQLRRDVAELLDTGFFATATVNSRPNPNGVGVTFVLSPVIVQSFRLTGAQALTQDVVNGIFRDQLASPISLLALEQGVQRVNQWYNQNGYTLARVLTVDPSQSGVVTIAVAEGVVGNVKIRFLDRDGKEIDDKGQPIRPRTQETFLRRQIKLQPGQPFQNDLVRQDLNRLNELGIFASTRVNVEGDAQQADVIYTLVERSPRALNFGGGYNDDLGVYGTLSFQDINFAGLAQRLGTNLQLGTRDIQGEVYFNSPYRSTDPATPGYGFNAFRRSGLSRVFDDKIKLPNGSRARERRIGAGVNLSKPLGPTWMGTLGLNYTNISLRDRDGNIFATDAQGNPLTLSGKGVDDLTTVSFTAIQDLRDNFINPGNGSVLTLSSEQAIPLGRGEIFGNRLAANYAFYLPVKFITSLRGDQPQVFAFNLQGGTTVGDLPPYNAFVLGGPNSVRGYDTGDVATSRSYVLASAEYRFPVYRFIGGVLFADFASDLGTSDEVLGEPGIDRDKPGSGFGFGLGLRFNSPIGILRTDFGFNNQGDSRLQFGFGQRF